MNKYLFVFPGIGYTEDRPLLYYSKKIALKYGYHMISHIKYAPVTDDIKNDVFARKLMIENELASLKGTLQELNIDPDNEILILSKSIGAAIASRYLKKCNFKYKAVYFTPIPEMFNDTVPLSGIVFHGTSDPWADTEKITTGCRDLDLSLYITEGANHSLETGDIIRDISELQKIMVICEDYIHG